MAIAFRLVSGHLEFFLERLDTQQRQATPAAAPSPHSSHPCRPGAASRGQAKARRNQATQAKAPRAGLDGVGEIENPADELRAEHVTELQPGR